MKIHDVKQGSVEWCNLRAGIPTASELDALVSPTGEVRTGEMPKTYLRDKLTEWYLGGALASANTMDMEAGKILEEDARPWYALTYDCDVEQVGFITTDDGAVGCSPDGLLANNRGLEIKCPKPETHAGYLLDGKLPKAYIAQVQSSMWVTGAESWVFLSFHRRFPKLVLEIGRDENYQNAISEALALFLAKFDAGKRRLIELNGGREPVRYKPMVKPAFEAVESDQGIVP